MGLDMNMYATQSSEANEQNLFEEEYYSDLKSWYWRKANQIHNWMVNNVQNGNDDCGLYEVSIDRIVELHKEVVFALATKDTSKLPPKAGFFFGPTDTDQWYWEDLADTKNYLEEMQDLFVNHEDTRFFYCSSW